MSGGRKKKIRLGIFTPDKTILSRGTSGPTPGDAWPPIIARTLSELGLDGGDVGEEAIHRNQG